MRIDKDEALRRLTSSKNLVLSLGSKSDQPNSNSNGSHTPLGSRTSEPTKNTPTENKVEHKTVQKPSRAGHPNVPEFLRDTIGELAASGTKQRELAAAFGVSQSLVSDYETGEIAGRPPTPERREKLIARNNRIKDVALDKLMTSLGLISSEMLADEDRVGHATKLSQVASNLSKVHASLSDGLPAVAPVQIVIYSPEPRVETKYRVVDV